MFSVFCWLLNEWCVLCFRKRIKDCVKLKIVDVISICLYRLMRSWLVNNLSFVICFSRFSKKYAIFKCSTLLWTVLPYDSFLFNNTHNQIYWNDKVWYSWTDIHAIIWFFKHEVTVYPNSIVLVCAVKTRVYPEICTPYLHVYVFLYLKITCQLAELRHWFAPRK